MISRSTDIAGALRSRQRGFFLNPFRFGGGGGAIDESAWDAASSINAVIAGKTAKVCGAAGYVRSDKPRSSGRRVFGLKLSEVNPPQIFFGGIAALTGWGKYDNGKHWLMYAYDGLFYYYPTGTEIALSPAPGAPTVVGDTAYFDFNFATRQCAVKKNGGAWSASVTLPNSTAGVEYVIDCQAPSTGSSYVGATLLTTPDELAGHIPAGATAWDSV